MADFLKTVLNTVTGIFGTIVSYLKKLFSRDDTPDEDDSDKGEIVVYYGCPNSNRVKKLQLEKRLYK